MRIARLPATIHSLVLSRSVCTWFNGTPTIGRLAAIAVSRSACVLMHCWWAVRTMSFRWLKETRDDALEGYDVAEIRALRFLHFFSSIFYDYFSSDSRWFLCFSLRNSYSDEFHCFIFNSRRCLVTPLWEMLMSKIKDHRENNVRTKKKERNGSYSYRGGYKWAISLAHGEKYG